MPIDPEYIRYLMLYSDQKYPFKMAKADPGLGEGMKSVNRYIEKNGSRKIDPAEAHRILLMEKKRQQEAGFSRIRRDITGRDRDDDSGQTLMDHDFTPKAEQQLNEIERHNKSKSDLEKELANLKKLVQDKEAELKARLNEQTPQSKYQKPARPLSPKDFGSFDKGNNGIVERKLEDTGYSDKINNSNE